MSSARGFMSIAVSLVGVCVRVMAEDVHAAPASPVSVAFPGCGPSATYCLMAAVGRNESLSQVQRRFMELDPAANLQRTSIAEIRDVLSSFGVKTAAIRVRPNSVSSVGTPAILFIKPGKWPGLEQATVGHFVCVVACDDSSVLAFDWSGTTNQPARSLSRKGLEQLWNGEAIVLVQPFPSVRYALTIASLGLLALALWKIAAYIPRRTKANGISAVVRLAALSTCYCISGCGQTVPPVKLATPLLQFESPVAQLGRVSGEAVVKHEFGFTVSTEMGVKIVDITTDCSCITADRSLVGKDLSAGSKGVIEVQVRPDGEGRTTTQTIRIQTTPPSPSPVTLAVRYQRLQGPVLSHDRVFIERANEIGASAELRVIHRRPVTEPPAKLWREKSSLEPFHLEQIEEKSETVLANIHTDEHVTVDSSIFQIKCKNPSGIGTNATGLIKLAFTDGTLRELLVTARSEHPWRPRLGRIYCGTLKAGESWHTSFPVSVSSDFAGSVKGIVSSRTSFNAEFAGDQLNITGKAPDTPGRFEVEFVVSFSPATLPDVKINLAGQVR